MVNRTNSLWGAIRDNGAQLFFQASTLFNSFTLQDARDHHTSCSALQGLALTQDLTILNSTYYGEGLTGAPIQVVPSCQTPAFNLGAGDVTSPLCRVRFKIDTSETSVVNAEIWLPDNWNGRFLAVGNGGLGGCVDYRSLDYGSALGFATVGSNNGHDGGSGEAFFNSPEVVNDFAHRAIHVQTLAGKQIAQAYYGQSHEKSYYLGCSTGGRQGFMSAMRYPEDFDGIVAGSPAVNFNRLTGSGAMLARYVGAPNAIGDGNPSFIPKETWKFVSQEILRQCDELDGLKDGIITEPDLCDFQPERLLCNDAERVSEECLSVPQVEALKKIYSPLRDSNGNVLFSRYDPGSEGALFAFSNLFAGEMFPIASDWYKYVVYNNSDYDFRNFGVKDVEFGAEMDPGGIATFTGDMSAFKARGGKLLTYHGRSDELIPSGNSKALYDLVSRSLDLPSLDSFYRLFLVPGLDHCFWGKGATNFNQHDLTRGPEATRNLSSHNVLLALVDWVEKDDAPDVIVGTSMAGEERKHCRYPWRSVWDKESETFDCVL
ncbi:tannase and feruloyl esterase [Schizopora paradoxa]|uniref:Carboxylic ester hydrolase n=1 Tax=Schizopora paradoxa TaxID=27342 RepID=A0A0H2RUE0_9AGAM|nr:tannase and feruloyl esterase [Schizopora paradoxa]